MADPNQNQCNDPQGDIDKHDLSSHEVKGVFEVKRRRGAYDNGLPVSPGLALALAPNSTSLQSGHVYSAVRGDSRVVT